MKEAATILANLSLLAPLVPAVLGLTRLKRSSQGQKLLVALMVFYLANQGLGEWMVHLKTSNFPLYHLNILVETCVLWLIFYLEKGLIFRPAKLFWGLQGILVVSWAISVAGAGGFWQPPTLSLTIQSVLLIVLALQFLWKTFQEMKVERVEREFLFWVTLGILVNFAGGLLIAAFFTFLTEREDVYYAVFMIRALLILFGQACYSIAMLCKAPPQRS